MEDLIFDNNELIIKNRLRELNLSPLDAFKACLLYKLECFIEISTTEKNRIWYT